MGCYPGDPTCCVSIAWSAFAANMHNETKPNSEHSGGLSNDDVDWPSDKWQLGNVLVAVFLSARYV